MYIHYVLMSVLRIQCVNNNDKSMTYDNMYLLTTFKSKRICGYTLLTMKEDIEYRERFEVIACC